MADNNGAVSPPPADEHNSNNNQVDEPASGTPGDFLKTVVGENVVVRLNSGVDYRGVLSCLDGYMNIALENTQEFVNGVHTNSYGDAFIRGNNVLYISKMA
ncbi:U4/U6-U5 snRNP complex subunit lsm6 [Microbotryomycetes sp. NB124-2]